ncbi:serine/threonine-protein kinase Nek11-like isoform X2 [Dreissena polymorpha]|uniref:serine/threonine-protein kinase Nek11-like isoform X2 n=1 Tax=Dreissena polymorpha TaxID=45954 RepID=UPI002264E99E|nr:serine/threonine-protein kinase Nek11-like isoform X2 [Dreissena polymorpha]
MNISKVKQASQKTKSSNKIWANRYQLVKKLGKGNFGTAFLCKDLRHKSTDQDGSLKVLKEISVGDLQPDETVDAMHEARLLRQLDHPSIVQFHDSFIDGESFCIVTEYCEGGDLDMKIADYKKNKKLFDEKTVMDWFVQLLLAVHYMHSRRVLHRDLKTRNIFLKKNIVKIGDFGISRILMGTTDLASTFTGTPYYMSPEVLKHEGYNSKSDVWSIGCILYEMCALDHAFDGKSLMSVMYKIVEGDPPELPSKYSRELSDIFKLMLKKEQDKRPTATELLKIPLISGHLAKMSEEYQAKHRNTHDTNNAGNHATEIANALKEKSRLDDLRKNEDEVKFKNLPPRERFRLKKQLLADKEAERLSKLTRVQLEENNKRKKRIQETLHQQSIPVWQGGAGEGSELQNALTVRGVPRKDFGTRSAPRIPDNDELANTYYSQFEDDFTSSDQEDEASETVIPRKPEYDNGDDDDDILFGSQDDTLKKDDEQDLYYRMQYVLDKGDDAEGTLTLADEDAGAFGPVARENKIRNLRVECEKMLGAEGFEKAYNYLKTARYERATEATEEDIMQGLREFVKNPSDCFLVDQLLFLEEQVGQGLT